MENKKEFPVKRLTNGRGDSHLVAIVEEAIADVYIGDVLIVPYASGFNEPTKVVILTDENGAPVKANRKFAIVLEYLFD